MRTFVALDVPEDLKSQLAVQQFLLPIPRKVARDQFHITLAFMGDLPDAALEALDEGLTALRMRTFELSLSGFGLFGKARPNAVWAAVAPSKPLSRLHAKVARAGRLAGAKIPARNFTPHITLGRFAPMGMEEAAPLERAVIAGAGFRAGPWEVAEMLLYHSTLTADGPRYDVLARYPLAG
ncbi:RNA 2',3'-cyclic phosphodiesterase [Pseudorhodobacter turbinis]|uniref:RNA 2',3'-cyclic phosphodiesterase n=1 Tax=Pseudorhodobacter turbinis TaxID=2500533 RepID=UPI00143D740A|nr:RNA 2',3'-cyclic phosphodiesterase [Pseudorhodobacter turbinis]